jgi:predicted glycosyltransferase
MPGSACSAQCFPRTFVTGTVLFYVQQLLGIGHLQRALSLVDAIAREDIAVTLVLGGEPPPWPISTRAERVVQLTPVSARDASFKELVGPGGQPIDQKLEKSRREALLTAFDAASPDAVVIEAFPFGRRAFRFELEPLLARARARRPRPRIICSLRDIVVVPDKAARRRDIIDRVRADFDFVLVHGDPDFIPLDESFPAASEIADHLIYTGYISAPDQPDVKDETAGADEVMVSVGGGAVGGTLLMTAVEARRRGCLSGLTWRLLAGPNLPTETFDGLAGGLPAGVVLERYRREFPQMLRRCRVSVSQAGYNTILNILAARVPAVVVPFASERETEQQFRAERLAARGVLELVDEADLTPDRLSCAIERAIERGPGTLPVHTGGARCAASLIGDIIRDPARVVRRQRDFMSPSPGIMIGG